MQTRLIAVLFLLAVTMALGCGESGPKLVPVTGTVTYGGGPWPKAGNINFNPAASGSGQIHGFAEFQPDGKFTVKSTGDKQGLVTGKYVVNIECWEVPPSMEPGAPAAKSYVPATFTQEIEILPTDKKKDLTIDVPKA